MSPEYSPKLGIPDAEEKLREHFSKGIIWDIAREDINEICLGCNQPIKPGEGVYFYGGQEDLLYLDLLEFEWGKKIIIHDYPVCIQKSLELPIINFDKMWEGIKRRLKQP